MHVRGWHHIIILTFFYFSMDRVPAPGWRVGEVCSWRGDRYLCVDLLYIARRLLKSLSVKQGIKYDSPESANHIPAFIEFHKLKVDEILDPLPSFSMSTSDSYRSLGDTSHF